MISYLSNSFSSRLSIIISIVGFIALGILWFIDFEALTPFYYYGTYYFVLTIFLLWLGQIVLSFRKERELYFSICRTTGLSLIFPLLVTFFIIITVEPYYNVPTGEMSGLTGSKMMLTEKTLRIVDTVIHEPNNLKYYRSVTNYRPVLFPFLVSIIHAVTGFNAANAFLLNAIVMGLILSIVFIVCKRTAGILVACATVLLIASCPVFSLTARSAGFDLLSAFFLGFTLIFLYKFMMEPQPHRFGLLWTSLLMTAYVREESFIFLFIIAVCLWFAGYWRRGQIGNTVLLAATPLLISPVLWLRIFKMDTYVGQPTRMPFFDISYFYQNVTNFLSNQLNFSNTLPYNTTLHWLALFVWGWILYKVFIGSKIPTKEYQKKFILIAAACVITYHTIVFSWWWTNTYTSPISIRFFVIFILFCALTPAVYISIATKTPLYMRYTLLIYSLGSFLYYHPIAMDGSFIRNYPMCQVTDYIRNTIVQYKKPNPLIVMDRPFRITDLDLPSIVFYNFRLHSKLYFNRHQQGVYSDIIIVQRISNADQPIKQDSLGSQYYLEKYAERKRGPGFRYTIRISQIRDIIAPDILRRRHKSRKIDQ